MALIEEFFLSGCSNGLGLRLPISCLRRTALDEGATSYLSVTTGSAWRLWAGEQVMVVDDAGGRREKGLKSITFSSCRSSDMFSQDREIIDNGGMQARRNLLLQLN